MKDIYRRKNTEVCAYRLTVSNMLVLERWSRGAIKGTKLPAKDRVIEIRTFDQRNPCAAVGDWIVVERGNFDVYTNEYFHKCFES